MGKSSKIWALLEEHVKSYPQDVVGPVSLRLIKDAESELGLEFNSEYKKFVLKYGGAGIGSKSVYGLRKHQDMSDILYSVITLTNFYKKEQNCPDIGNWYIISEDFDGNPIGIDPEGKVWLSDHDSGFEQIKLADSFEEFLYKLYTDTLYE